LQDNLTRIGEIEDLQFCHVQETPPRKLRFAQFHTGSQLHA